MKKLLCLVVVALMLLSPVATLAAGETVTSLNANAQNVRFSNGYTGYCIDRWLDGSDEGSEFLLAGDTSAAINNDDLSDVSQKLKVLFTHCFEDIFEWVDSSGYTVKDTNMLQACIWNITDSDHVWGESAALVNKVNAYDGPTIPDSGHSITLSNGDTITFDFVVMLSKDTDIQDFFAYKIAVNQTPSHTHDYANDWSADEENHWHECECGDKKDVDEHTGGEATCENPAVCEVCGETYGSKDEETHTGGTEVRDAVEATEFEPGYTGDTYCKGCDELLEEGEEIPATHEHDHSDKWTTDEENHWHECECGDKADEGEHTGGEANCKEPAVCEVCGESYGSKDEEKHTGETEIRDAKEATEFEPGYTGDAYCKGCDGLLEKGEEIPVKQTPSHTHVYEEDWSSDEEDHWHECECGDKNDLEEHTFKGRECIICGEVNPGYADEAPATGDDHGIFMWLMMVILCLAGCVMITNLRRKNNTL